MYLGNRIVFGNKDQRYGCRRSFFNTIVQIECRAAQQRHRTHGFFNFGTLCPRFSLTIGWLVRGYLGNRSIFVNNSADSGCGILNTFG